MADCFPDRSCNSIFNAINNRVLNIQKYLFSFYISSVSLCFECTNECFIYLFGVLHRFQHSKGNITTGSWKGRGNQYVQLVTVLYCKLPTNGKQLPAFPLEVGPGTEHRPQRWEARVLSLCHRAPLHR